MKIVIVDSSTLILLLDTNNFSLLFKLFKEIIITNAVYAEITSSIAHKELIDSYITKRYMKIVKITKDSRIEMLLKRLDIGESESIALAKKIDLPLIIDEKKGRAIAKSLNIKIIGFIGIILKLIEKNIISKEKAIDIIKQAEINNFRLSKELKNLIYNFKIKEKE